MHCRWSVYSPPDTHIWLETVILWPFVLFSTPSCNISLQRQTESHLSRLMQSQKQTAPLWNYSTITFLFVSPQNDLFLFCCFQISCVLYLILYYSISCFTVEIGKPFFHQVTGYMRFYHTSQSAFEKWRIYKPQCKDRTFSNLSLTKTDLNVTGAPICLPSGPLNSVLLSHLSLSASVSLLS